ncbi:MAG: ATP-dependent DNA helicase [Deltaproteobacteria bacterium]
MIFNSRDVEAYFLPEGKMAGMISGYSFRREQLSLAKEIAEAFVNREFLVSEAGTGVGKSYAYLVPAILWSVNEGKKVVVSTRTRALQQQLVEKDIPEIIRVTGTECRFVEAKGRENYLCWHKFNSISMGKIKIDESEMRFIEKILTWTRTTTSGDRKELGISSELMRHWPLVAADRHSCLKDACPHNRKCFRLKMIRQMEKANLIVVNHALLLSDIVVNNALLPEYRHLIIDEAHAFEKEAFDKLSLRLALSEINDLLSILKTREKRRDKGYLQHLRSNYAHLSNEITEASMALDRLQRAGRELFGTMTMIPGSGRDTEYSRVLKPADFHGRWFIEVLNQYFAWQDTLRLLMNVLRGISRELEGFDDKDELDAFILSLQEFSDTATVIFEENADTSRNILWMDFYNGQASAISSSMVGIGDELNQRLYEKLDSVVMVSATLAVEDSFDYFVERCGLSPVVAQERVRTLLEYSPFDYEQQARLFSIENMPDPLHPDFPKALASSLREVIIAAGGQCLILFTARKQMLDAASVIRPFCEDQGIRLLVQNEDGEFGYLMSEFTSADNTILMGLETFWEGIDLKGDLLRCVVIVKLPFRAPTDPYSCAGELYCRQQRKNSFEHFMLPDAAVRFKQGTGRLIRSETDHGAIVVLDSRFDKKAYGNVFKRSIPIKKQELLPSNLLASRLRDFLQQV